MMMSDRISAPRASKSKHPLADLNQIRQAVKALQKESDDQLHLEVESQATFDFLNGQISALKLAYTTLSDVLMSEVDGVRKDTVRRVQELEGEVTRQQTLLKHANGEISQLKRMLDVW